MAPKPILYMVEHASISDLTCSESLQKDREDDAQRERDDRQRGHREGQRESWGQVRVVVLGHADGLETGSCCAIPDDDGAKIHD